MSRASCGLLLIFLYINGCFGVALSIIPNRYLQSSEKQALFNGKRLYLNCSIDNTKNIVWINKQQVVWKITNRTVFSWFRYDASLDSWIKFGDNLINIHPGVSCKIPPIPYTYFKIIAYQIVTHSPLRIQIDKLMKEAVTNQRGRWSEHIQESLHTIPDSSEEESALSNISFNYLIIAIGIIITILVVVAVGYIYRKRQREREQQA
eukprot:146456_1